MISFNDFLKRVPKVELHCHFEGTLRPETIAELANKHKIQMPTHDLNQLFKYNSIYEFLKIFSFASSILIDREDFARTAYESLEDGVQLGNLKYREMFFNPTLHTKRGIPYQTILDGLIDGISEAERQFGVRCRLIADIYRQDTPKMALQMVEDVLAYPKDELIGLGMDGAEALDPPENFFEAFKLAKKGGLRLTAHACEDAPAKNITTCLDLLGCERIDHGYHILSDYSVLERCRNEGITFTVCPTASAVCYFDLADLTKHPICEMAKQGLKIVINSDDPTMFHTDIGKEYVKIANAANWSIDQVCEYVFNGIDAAWLDSNERRILRRDFEKEIQLLRGKILIDK